MKRTFTPCASPATPPDAADLTRAEIQGRKDAMAMFQAWKKVGPRV